MKGCSFPTGRRYKEAWAWTQAGLAWWRQPRASPLTDDQAQEEGVSWHQMSAARADLTCRSRPSLHPLLKHSLGLPGRSCFSRGHITWGASSLDQGKVHAGDSGGQQRPLPAWVQVQPMGGGFWAQFPPCTAWIAGSCHWIQKQNFGSQEMESWIFNFLLSYVKEYEVYGVIVTLPRRL